MKTEESQKQIDLCYKCTNHDDLCFTDEHTLLVATSSLTNRYWNGQIAIYNNLHFDQQSSKKRLDQPPNHTAFSLNTISNIKYLSNTNKVLTTHDSGEVTVWQLPQEDDGILEVACEVGHDDAVLSLDINCDQSRYATTSSDCQLKVWCTEDSSAQAVYTGHSERVTGVSFKPHSPDLLSTCAHDMNVLLWDLRGIKPVTASIKLEATTPSCITYLPNDPNCLLIGSEEGQVILLDTRNLNSALCTFDLHQRAINRMTFCPLKPDLLATCSDDLEVMVSKVTKQCRLKPVYKDCSHSDMVRGVAWWPGEQGAMVSCGWDGLLGVHDFGGSLEDAALSGVGDV